MTLLACGLLVGPMVLSQSHAFAEEINTELLATVPDNPSNDYGLSPKIKSSRNVMFILIIKQMVISDTLKMTGQIYAFCQLTHKIAHRLLCLFLNMMAIGTMGQERSLVTEQF